MRPVALLVLATLHLAAASDTTGALRGVGPEEASRYIPDAEGRWTCLDGSKTLQWDRVNDNYCDCPDGSDEPGSSACSNSHFYCANPGHRPSSIPSWKVDDGMCEPECCDGSDEADGSCPNRCVEAHEAYIEQREAAQRIRKAGIAQRQKYLEYGRGAREKWEKEVKEKEEELEGLTARVDEFESLSKRIADAERESQGKLLPERLKTRLRQGMADLEDLQRKVEEKDRAIRTLESILKTMSQDYNKNYHDMAVKKAVTEYETYTEEHGQGEGEETVAGARDDFSHISNEQLLAQEVLSGTEEGEGEGRGILGQVKSVWEATLRATGIRGILMSGDRVKDSTGTYQDGPSVEAILSEAREKKQQVLDRIGALNSKLSKDFGVDGEFSELDGQCFDKDTGEYTYQVCLFGAVTQKSNKDGQSTHLGDFSQWKMEGEEREAKYMKQEYMHGTQCWNGPQRSVQLGFECGATNTIMSVSEPEKCTYHIKMMTPAVCREGLEEGQEEQEQEQEEGKVKGHEEL